MARGIAWLWWAFAGASFLLTAMVVVLVAMAFDAPRAIIERRWSFGLVAGAAAALVIATDVGMTRLALFIAGPAIWATSFALVYALHGAGCNLGWRGIDVAGMISLHRLALWAGWLATLLANLALLRKATGDWLAR